MKNKINFEKLGLAIFGLGIITMFLSVMSLWFMLPGIVLYIVGADTISRSNDLHNYYERKIKGGK